MAPRHDAPPGPGTGWLGNAVALVRRTPKTGKKPARQRNTKAEPLARFTSFG